MTWRTASGRSLKRRRAKAPKRARTKDEAAHPDLGAVTWSFLLLLFSVMLTAAAVFTHQPL
jgi:hypothetical protein